MKFALTADWHLCSRHLGVSKRGSDYTAAALSAVEVAQQNSCQIILNGGDTFHDKRPTSANVAALMLIDEELVKRGMQMYTIDGDHDASEPSWWATLLPPRHEKDFGIIAINNRTVRLPDGTTVHGIPPCDPATFKGLLEAFPTPGPDIILWHGAIREFCGYPNPLAFSMDDIPVGKFRAVLCGDQHKPHQFSVRGTDGLVVGYPGATELRGRDESVFNRSIAIFETADFSNIAAKISHRPAYAYQIRTSDQLDEVANKLRKLPKDPWPMVFIRYDRDVPNVKATITAALDNPEAILRAAPAPAVNLTSMLFGSVAAAFEHKRPEDFIQKYFPVSNDLRTLAVALCDPDAAHKDLLDTYVEAQQSA